MAKIYNSAEELIGHTPLLRLSKIEKLFGLNARLLAKLESFNVTGSAKDRVAKEMLDDAEHAGLIKPGATIIEPTSGNTGIGLASVGCARGYKVIIVMPDTMSVERQKLIRAYGAQVLLTPGELGMSGAIKKAEELKNSTPDSFIPGQFTNPANPASHYKTTGPEIFFDTDGNIDYFIAGVGTGGTLSGCGKYLKEKIPSLKVIAVEPASSPLLSGGKAGAHEIQGIGANFIPQTLDRTIYDEVIPVTNEDALKKGALIGKTEGFLAGISSGAALHAAIQVASRPENCGKTIAVLFPDTGDHYLSTDMFD